MLAGDSCESAAVQEDPDHVHPDRGKYRHQQCQGGSSKEDVSWNNAVTESQRPADLHQQERRRQRHHGAADHQRDEDRVGVLGSVLADHKSSVARTLRL